MYVLIKMKMEKSFKNVGHIIFAIIYLLDKFVSKGERDKNDQDILTVISYHLLKLLYRVHKLYKCLRIAVLKVFFHTPCLHICFII